MKNVCIVGFLLFFCTTAYGAYHHDENTDSDIVLEAYPELAGTKLDSCALCHTGGEYVKSTGKEVSLGSCQWCHYDFGYDGSGDINNTLNAYGVDYRDNGRDVDAFATIAGNDSDGDGYSNEEEIAALRFPGDVDDDPAKVDAPYQVISRDDLENMEYHSQIMLMNTHKSGDFYAEYGGVTMADILNYSGILPGATGITVFAPDGWSQYHPLEEEDDASMYHVYGKYPKAPFYYDIQADQDESDIGWCDYSSEALLGLQPGAKIVNKGGLRMLLAFTRDGGYLESGALTLDNKLDGEGPFRVVPPQKNVGPPDQSVKSDYQDVIWPFSDDNDHNAGFATRSATIIKVEPLPEGTTDIDTLEAGWNYVDEKKILVYGAIDPFYTVLEKLLGLKQAVREMDASDFKRYSHKRNFLKKIHVAEKMLKKGHDNSFSHQLSSLATKVNGCSNSEEPDRDDWITNCDSQLVAHWAIHEMTILMGDDD